MDKKKLLNQLIKTAEEFKDTVKVNNEIENTSEIVGQLLNKKGAKQGHFDLMQHTPDMMEEIVTNPKFQADNPFYLSEIQAAQKEGGGKRMLDEALHQAQIEGADKVYLQADPTINLKYGQKPLTQEELNNFYKKNKFEQPNKSTNFGATPFVRDLEKNPALDMSTEARLQRAIDQGYKPVNGKPYVLQNERGVQRSINASFDPALQNKKGLLYGVGAASAAAPHTSPDISPMPIIQQGLDTYNKYKDKAVDFMANQLNFSKDPTTGEVIKTGLSLGADPLNYVEGPVGLGIGAMQMMGDSKPVGQQKPEFAEGGMVDTGGLPEGFTLDEPAQAPSPQQLMSETPDHQVAMSSGLPEGFTLDEEKYGGTENQVKAGLEGVAKGIAGPIAPFIETHVMHIKPSEIRGRAEEHPITHGLGEATGLGIGMMTGTGEASVMKAMGEGAVAVSEAAGILNAADKSRLLYKVGSEAVKQAAEMAVYQSGDEVAKQILKDPNASAESAIANIGLSSVLGAGTGALFAGAINPLWEATLAPKVEGLLNGLKDHLNGGSKLILPEQTEQAIQKLGIEVSPVTRAGISKDPKAVEQYNILKENQNKEVLEGIDKLHKDVSDSVVQSLGVAPDEIHYYSKSDAGHDLLDTFKSEYKQKYEPFEEAFKQRNAEAAKVLVPDEARLNSYGKMLERAVETVGTDSPYYKLYEEYGQRILAKDTVGGMDMLKSEINNRVKGLKVGGDFNVINALNDIKGMIGSLQEKEIMNQAALAEREGLQFGKALGSDMVKERQALNQQYAEFANMSDELTNHLGVGDFYGAKGLENKLTDKLSAEQLMNKFSFRNNADFIGFLQKNFPETLQQVQKNELKEFLKPAMLSAKGETEINVKKLNDLIEKGMAGRKDYVEAILPKEALERAKAAQQVLESIPNPKSSGTAGWMAKIMNKVPQSALAAVSMIGGHNPITGYLGGEMASRLAFDAPNAIRLGYLKFLASDQPVQAGAFKSMVEFMHNTYKQENMMSKAAVNLFKAGSDVLKANNMPDETDRMKLDKKITEFNKNQASLLNNQADNHLGYYLPQHQTAAAATVANAAQYLNQLKPHETQAGVLDKKIPPSPMEKARYDRALDIAQQPLVVLEHIKQGTLQASDIKDLNSIYPALYQQMVGKLTNEMNAMQGAEAQIPYKTRMSLSLFMGQPLDSTMQPASIQAAQPIPQQPQPQNKKPSQSAAKAMEKGHNQYMTPLQGSEAHKASR